jgi:hypothetical protein
MVFLFKILRRVVAALVALIIIVPIYIAGSIWWTAHHLSIKQSDAIVVLGAAQDNGKPTRLRIWTSSIDYCGRWGTER